MSSPSNKGPITAARVWFFCADSDYERVSIVVRNEPAIKQYGYFEAELNAPHCVTYEQAERVGQHALTLELVKFESTTGEVT